MFVIVANLVTGITAARALLPEGRGISLAVGLWPLIVSGAATFGVPVALAYYGRRHHEERDDLFTTALLLSAGAGFLAASVGAFVVIPHVLHHYSPFAVRFAQWMMLFTPQLLILQTMSAYLDVRGEFSRSNALVIAASGSTVVLQLLLLLTHHLDPYSNCLAYMTPGVITTAFLGLRIRPYVRFTRGFRRRSKLLLGYGVRVYGLDLLNTLSGQIDQTLVVGLLSAKSFGLYSAGLNITRVLGIVQTSINTVLFPRAASLNDRDAMELISRTARVSLIGTVACAGAFALVTPVVIPLFYGKAFAGIVPITRILTIEALVQGSLAVLGQAFMATGRPGLITIQQIGGLLTSFPLMLLLIPRFGLTGAALALLGSTLVRGALLLGSFPMLLHYPVPRLLPMRRDFKDILVRFQLATARLPHV